MLGEQTREVVVQGTEDSHYRITHRSIAAGKLTKSQIRMEDE